MNDLCEECIHLCVDEDDDAFCELDEDPDDCDLYQDDWSMGVEE